MLCLMRNTILPLQTIFYELVCPVKDSGKVCIYTSYSTIKGKQWLRYILRTRDANEKMNLRRSSCNMLRDFNLKIQEHTMYSVVNS